MRIRRGSLRGAEKEADQTVVEVKERSIEFPRCVGTVLEKEGTRRQVIHGLEAGPVLFSFPSVHTAPWADWCIYSICNWSVCFLRDNPCVRGTRISCVLVGLLPGP